MIQHTSCFSMGCAQTIYLSKSYAAATIDLGSGKETWMQLVVRGQSFTATPGLCLRVEERINQAIARFGRRVGQVRAFFSDLNGPRGGADKRCRITAQIVGFKTVQAEDTGPDLYTAIDRAVHRTQRLVERELSRVRASRRRRQPVPSSFN
jgi:putative sigma-54 modulation protein